MNTSQLLGVAALILGAVLLGFDYHFSEAPIDHISNALTGRYTDSTMWYIIDGAVMVVSGSLLAVLGKRI